MKKIILLISLLFFSVAGSAQGIEFSKNSYADLLKQAKKEKKAIFIDIYTSWCGPCKHMADNIFTLAEVGALYNEKFINAKFDAEKTEDGKFLAKTFGVSAYPTFLFINGNGELVYKFLGGRDKKGIATEADKALLAYDSYPALKKMEKNYIKGDRSKEFLNKYFIARNNSGLDCGDVLIEYFNLLTDAEITDTTNYRRIEKISKYDATLTKRIIDLTVKAHNNGTLEKKGLTELNKGVGKFLSGVMSQAAKNDDEKAFDEILALKEQYFTIKGNSNSVTNASLGGGNIFIPSEMLRLDFYDGKKKSEKFISTLESYIAKLISENPEKKATQKALEDELNTKREVAIKNNDKEMLEGIKRMEGFIGAFSGMDDYYVSTTLISYIKKYENLYKGAKDTKYEDRIVEWYKILSDLKISCKTAHYVAEQLIERGRNSEAKEILTISLEKGQKAIAVEPTDIEKCKEILNSLSSK